MEQELAKERADLLRCAPDLVGTLVPLEQTHIQRMYQPAIVAMIFTNVDHLAEDGLGESGRVWACVPVEAASLIGAYSMTADFSTERSLKWDERGISMFFAKNRSMRAPIEQWVTFSRSKQQVLALSRATPDVVVRMRTISLETSQVSRRSTRQLLSRVLLDAEFVPTHNQAAGCCSLVRGTREAQELEFVLASEVIDTCLHFLKC